MSQLTLCQRGTPEHALIALDESMAEKTYRQIAIALFGEQRVAGLNRSLDTRGGVTPCRLPPLALRERRSSSGCDNIANIEPQSLGAQLKLLLGAVRRGHSSTEYWAG